jgi:hypothetical protein
MSVEEIVYATSDDEREVQLIQDRLWYDEDRRSVVARVADMAIYDLIKCPRTSDRWAIIVKRTPSEDT